MLFTRPTLSDHDFENNPTLDVLIEYMGDLEEYTTRLENHIERTELESKGLQ